MKYILWDFDGTLAFREGMWTATLYSVLLNNSITHIGKEEIRSCLNIGFPWHSPDIPHTVFLKGKTWWEYMEDFFQKVFLSLMLDTETAIDVAKQVRAEYMKADQWFLYQDIRNTLEEVMQLGYTNVIVSNHIPELSEIVSTLRIESYFHKIYSSANIGYEKPNTKIFEFVLHDLGIHKDNCVMVGDSYDADIGGAERVGIKSILVRKANDKSYQYYTESIAHLPFLLHPLLG